MSPPPVATVIENFATLEDPRRYNKRHLLLDIVTIAICAVIGGADNWGDVANFGQAKSAWFQQFLELPHGIPTHDTFGRVFALLDPEQFQRCFIQWIQAVYELIAGQIVPIDGKTLRRSHDNKLGQDAIHMVSAWAAANHLVLGQIKVDDKANEITAIPQLLELLDISGCLVTIDALGCQKKIAEQLIKQEADYVLAVKGNQAHLFADVQELFAQAQATAFADCAYHQTVERGHGRRVRREWWTIAEPEQLHQLRHLTDWPALHAVIKVRAHRWVGDKHSREDRYYISSLDGDAPPCLNAVRGHWSIENQLHWVLDIAFREDDSRIRKGNGAQNFALLRHLALNLLKQEQTAQCGIKAKRLKAGWDEHYLCQVLAG